MEKDKKNKKSKKDNNMDLEKIKKAVTLLLEGIGEDPGRPGLLKTPERVAKMYEEIFSGLETKKDSEEILNPI